MHLVGDGEEALEQAHNEVVARVALHLVVVGEHLAAGVEQEQAEEAQHPLEALHHGGTGKDEHAAQHQRAKDAPEEHLVLKLALNAKIGKKHQENEEVVHRQRLLNQIARQELHRLLVRFNGIEEVDARTEHHRHGYPHTRHLQSLADVHLVLAFVSKHLQVGNQHQHHQHIESNPSPYGQ